MNKKISAISLLEFCIVLGICAVLYSFGIPTIKTNLSFAHSTLYNNINLTKTLSLSDDFAFLNIKDSQRFNDLFGSIDPNTLLKNSPHSMWQIQFHQSGTYTLNSYSIYIDTPRFSNTTNLDSRPMSADVIPLSSGACLSGYNNTNTANNCKNNTLAIMRLNEYFGIETMDIQAQAECQENKTARIYFDHFGKVYCGKSPTRLRENFIITLHKDGENKRICILPNGDVLDKC